MAGSILFEEQIEVPMGLHSLAEFRRWATSDEFPERGRIDYIAGRIEVDLSPEDLYTHGTVKTKLVMVLGARVESLGTGDLFSDRTRVSCPHADLSAEPDIVFVSEEGLESGRVKLVPKASGEPDRYIEFEGAPDLVVEILSDSSVKKDTERLPPACFAAGVIEYWLVDARRETLEFIIHRRGLEGYEPADVDAEGYQHSSVMGCWYRLDRFRNPRGRLKYDLRAKETPA